MATVSAGILTILVITGLSIWAVESIPEGCRKIDKRFGKHLIPNKFIVKFNASFTDDEMVKIMLELVTSGCEGKLWRSSNTSNAVMKPITCSNMIPIMRFSLFTAKLSDAAIIWVSEQQTKACYTKPVLHFIPFQVAYSIIELHSVFSFYVCNVTR